MAVESVLRSRSLFLMPLPELLRNMGASGFLGCLWGAIFDGEDGTAQPPLTFIMEEGV